MADIYKDRRYSVYFFNPETLKAIVKLAEKEHRSISSVVTDACNSYLVYKQNTKEKK